MKEGKLNPEIPNPTSVAFGFGRRVCPGRHLAYESTWIAIATTLAAFNICKAKDDSGNPISPPEDYVEGFLR